MIISQGHLQMPVSRRRTASIGAGERPRIRADAQKARARYGNQVDVFVGDLADAEMLGPLSREDALLPSTVP
jgi:hypothetical protein